MGASRYPDFEGFSAAGRWTESGADDQSLPNRRGRWSGTQSTVKVANRKKSIAPLSPCLPSRRRFGQFCGVMVACYLARQRGGQVQIPFRRPVQLRRAHREGTVRRRGPRRSLPLPVARGVPGAHSGPQGILDDTLEHDM